MFCPDCGIDHHAEDRERETTVSAEVEIARIQAERDVAVARLARGEVKLAAEAQVESAEVVAAAQVEEAVVKADVLDTILTPEPEPEPVVIVAPDEAPAEEMPADAEPPDMEQHAPAAASKSSNPWWG